MPAVAKEPRDNTALADLMADERGRAWEESSRLPLRVR